MLTDGGLCAHWQGKARKDFGQPVTPQKSRNKRSSQLEAELGFGSTATPPCCKHARYVFDALEEQDKV